MTMAMRSAQIFAKTLVILSLLLIATPLFAQAPQHTTYTGRLVDNAGTPLPGPVNLELRIYDGEMGGSPLYTEQHFSIVLDASGGFSVQLGLGTNPVGIFDAALFSQPNRWLEVIAGGQVLLPRQILGSAPWALIAQQANQIVLDPNAPRFEDCSDGTIADHQTGLMWEKKTGAVGSIVDCDTNMFMQFTANCSDPHFVGNRYTWSTGSSSNPDGSAFTNFLARLNGGFVDTAAATDVPLVVRGFGDWRLPTIYELRTILIGPGAAPGQATTCPAIPCVDPGFAAVGGPTAPAQHWSSTTVSGGATFGNAWVANFVNSTLPGFVKASFFHVRAVRVGSCE